MQGAWQVSVHCSVLSFMVSERRVGDAPLPPDKDIPPPIVSNMNAAFDVG